VHETGQIPDAKTLADRLAIYDVLVRHSRGVDRGDAAVLKSAYWSNAEVAYGAFDGSAHVWKILHRRVLMDWNQHAPASAKWQGAPFDGLARGTRDANDPMYTHLGG
jgi:WD40 repeat protein